MDNEFNFNSDNSFHKAIPVKKPKQLKNVAVSFISGVLGASLVLGTCFGVPSIRNTLINNTSKNNTIINTSTGSATDLINLTEYSNTAVAVANRVLPSVVGITVNYSVNSLFGQGETSATGSGIIISNDGYIVTNNHVISTESSSSYYQITQATSIVVKLYNDSTEYQAKVIGTDSYTDLAIIKIDAENLTAATLGDSENLKVGEFVMAIGNPLGMDSTVTSGIVSALNREVEDDEGNTYISIQTDAAINSGNSGGALVNSLGEVIGINSMKLAGSGIEGIGFAIPISSATTIINQLINNGSVVRPFIGISGSDVTENISKRYNVPQGVYVEEIIKDSSAEKSGLKVGDIITAINGNNIKTISELNKIKYTYNVGDKISLTITRESKEINIELVLTEETEESKNSTSTSSNQNQNQAPSFNFEDFFNNW